MTERPQAAVNQAALFGRLSDGLPPLMQQYRQLAAPHALMLSGPFGVGKSTLAGLLAQSLLCQGEGRPCETCPACKQAGNRSHPNLLVVSAQQRQRSVKVEQARALLQNLASYPFAKGPRVVMLERVDTFTPQAQNALLKALEEPDSATCFITTCENENAVLTTIRSRCRIVRLPPWPEELVLEVLLQHQIKGQEAQELARIAMGSPGKALATRDDSAFWQMKDSLDQMILQDGGMARFPGLSNRLREMKDRAGQALDYLEAAALGLLSSTGASSKRARTILEGVLKAREQQASNLSWQAIIDGLLMNILEEQQHA